MMNTDTATDLDKTLAQLVQKSLDMFRPILRSEGCDANLVSVKEGVATVELVDSGCSGCGSTPMAALAPGLKRTILERVDGLRDVEFLNA